MLTESPSVTEVLPVLIDALGVAGTGELLRFAVAGRMQGRTHSDAVLSAVSAAKLRKAETNKPFWEALFEQLPLLPPSSASEILTLARFHQRMDSVATRFEFRLDGSSFSRSLKDHLGMPSDQILALSSRVRLPSGVEAHIPMLDYRVPINVENDSVILGQLTAMRSSGWLFASGRSYHFLGDTLLKGHGELSRFLGDALLYAPIVDGRWIAHQLIEGACALRVSSGDGAQIVPRLVSRVLQP